MFSRLDPLKTVHGQLPAARYRDRFCLNTVFVYFTCYVPRVSKFRCTSITLFSVHVYVFMTLRGLCFSQCESVFCTALGLLPVLQLQGSYRSGDREYSRDFGNRANVSPSFTYSTSPPFS